MPSMQETRVRSLGQEDSWEKGLATHPSILAYTPTEFHGQTMGSGHKKSDTTEQLTHTHTHTQFLKELIYDGRILEDTPLN